MVQRVVTKRGYWEADGVDVPVHSDREMKVMVGFKKNWTFYLGTETRRAKERLVYDRVQSQSPFNSCGSNE